MKLTTQTEPAVVTGVTLELTLEEAQELYTIVSEDNPCKTIGELRRNNPSAYDIMDALDEALS